MCDLLWRYFPQGELNGINFHLFKESLPMGHEYRSSCPIEKYYAIIPAVGLQKVYWY